MGEVVPGEEDPLVLFAVNPLDDETRVDICLKPSLTMRQAKAWLCRRFPGLKQNKVVIVTKRWNDDGYKPCDSPGKSEIPDRVLLRDTNLKHGDELKYFYVGDADVDMGSEPSHDQV